jgi:hypothetical protein
MFREEPDAVRRDGRRWERLQARLNHWPEGFENRLELTED